MRSKHFYYSFIFQCSIGFSLILFFFFVRVSYFTHCNTSNPYKYIRLWAGKSSKYEPIVYEMMHNCFFLLQLLFSLCYFFFLDEHRIYTMKCLCSYRKIIVIIENCCLLPSNDLSKFIVCFFSLYVFPSPFSFSFSVIFLAVFDPLSQNIST